jgi:hypothetical protein
MSGFEYIRLLNAVKSTEGHEVYWQVNSVIVSHGILTGNYIELHRRLSEFADPKVASRLFDQGRRSESQAELHELARLVHNYVASVKSLVDHTRVIANKILDGDKLAAYQERVNSEFKNDTTSKFLQDLRNFLLHISHPTIKAKFNFNQPAGMTSGIELAADELLAWDNWSTEGRNCIENSPDGVAMLPLVEDYKKKVDAFCRWLVDFFYDSRQREMNEFSAMQDEWAKFCRSNGIPITESEFRAFLKRQ